MDESEHKTKLIKQCRNLGAYARRFEDQYGVGILDTLVAFPDMPVIFAEGKTIESISFGPTERQWVEGQRVLAVRGGHTIPLLIGWTPRGIMYVGEWTRRLPLKACFIQREKDDYATTLWRYMNDVYKPSSRVNTGSSAQNSVRQSVPYPR